MSAYLLPSDILLPDFSKVDGTKWAVVACDQYTSEPAYWHGVKELVGEEPSMLSLILPELWLDKTEECVPEIHANMQAYEGDVLERHPNTMLYLERTQSNGLVRRGIVGMIDLEHYDYNKGSTSLVRATEGTVLERIPPRLAVRRGAGLESPHVMLLIDDPDCTVIEPIAARADSLPLAYDFELMQKSGHVKAHFVDTIGVGRITRALCALASPEHARKQYRTDAAPLLFAVGDGNHSLATAKAAYEEIKAELGERALNHPARYALVEVVNLHDPALHFEPIYRVLFNVDVDDVLKELQAYSYAQQGLVNPQKATFLCGKRRGRIYFMNPTEQLVVGTLQAFIDLYLAKHPEAHVDYIHGKEAVQTLSAADRTIGFLFSGMEKSELFPTVMKDGALPRKTFSMGAAADKRFYLECRKIR